MLRFRDSLWKRDAMMALGHQVHRGRVSPWSWERQYHSYFTQQGLIWQDVAADKESWAAHKEDWIRFLMGCRSASAFFGGR